MWCDLEWISPAFKSGSLQSSKLEKFTASGRLNSRWLGISPVSLCASTREDELRRERESLVVSLERASNWSTTETISSSGQKQLRSPSDTSRSEQTIERVLGLNRVTAFDGRYATLAIVAVVLLTFAMARAHDHERPGLNAWYESLRNGRGPCCDGSDARRVDDADWEIKDGHYRVRIDGEWLDVPWEAVVNGPNRAGRTMVWPYYKDGHPKARCFMPGSMS